ncbi:hypothetical protein [Streptacidiphilus albus]|uniref:hypothetical protein n=1 Tax=Streptacidiphilus albus TaxID=105425 RepID=UPI0012E049BC|nr:hypothetical protein [Streptacidiphilus albus]
MTYHSELYRAPPEGVGRRVTSHCSGSASGMASKLSVKGSMSSGVSHCARVMPPRSASIRPSRCADFSGGHGSACRGAPG